MRLAGALASAFGRGGGFGAGATLRGAGRRIPGAGRCSGLGRRPKRRAQNPCFFGAGVAIGIGVEIGIPLAFLVVAAGFGVVDGVRFGWAFFGSAPVSTFGSEVAAGVSSAAGGAGGGFGSAAVSCARVRLKSTATETKTARKIRDMSGDGERVNLSGVGTSFCQGDSTIGANCIAARAGS